MSKVLTPSQKTVEELLKPRFKVDVDYPNSPYKTGCIIHCADAVSGDVNYFKQYPAVFKRLGWAEDRTADELSIVQYVGYTLMEGSEEKILKIEHHKLSSFGNFNKDGFIVKGFFYCYSKSRIATEQEYNAYINK